jgi:hypothetical protein
MADIKFVVSVDTVEGKAQIKALEGEIEKMGTTGNSAGKTAAEGTNYFTAGLSQLKNQVLGSLGAYALATRAWHEFSAAVGECISAASEQEAADHKLQMALTITGRSVDENFKHFSKLATEIMHTTGIEDDAIIRTQSLLTMLTDLDRKGLDQATKGAAGLAKVMGVDVESAVRMVAQGFEGNFMMLGRFIPAIRNATGETEKHAAFVKALDQMYRLAQTSGETWDGKITKLKNNIKEMAESVGNAVVKNEELRGTIDLLNKAMEDFQTSGALDKLVAGIVNLFDQMPFFKMALDTVRIAAIQMEIAAKKAEAINEMTEAMKRAGINAKEAGLLTRMVWIGAAPILNTIAEANEKLGKHLDKVKTETKLVETAVSASRTEWEGLGVQLKITAGLLLPLGNTDIPKNRVEMKAWQLVLDQTADSVEILKTNLQSLGPVNHDIMFLLEKQLPKVTPVMKKAAEEIRHAFMDALQSISGFFGALTNLSQANAAREIAELDEVYDYRKKLLDKQYGSSAEHQAAISALDKEYSDKKKAIENDLTLSAEVRQARLIALEDELNGKKDQVTANEKARADAEAKMNEELAAKKRQIQRDAAQQQKNSAIVEAMINTSVAFTKALTAAIPPFNYILAALTLAQGYIQIAAIKAQPLPLAAGGILSRPTFSADGRFEAGEAGAEAVIPISDRVKRRVQAAMSGDSAGRPIYHNHIYLDGKEIGGFILDTVQDAGERGALRQSRWRTH